MDELTDLGIEVPYVLLLLLLPAIGTALVDGVLLLGFLRNAAKDALDIDLLLVIETFLSNEEGMFCTVVGWLVCTPALIGAGVGEISRDPTLYGSLVIAFVGNDSPLVNSGLLPLDEVNDDEGERDINFLASSSRLPKCADSTSSCSCRQKS